MICSASRWIHPNFVVGCPFAVQNPLLWSFLMSSSLGAVMTISEPVERRLMGRADPLYVVTTRWMPSLPMAHRVPRKWACSLRAWVIFVFSARKRELEALTEEGFQFFLYLFRKLSRSADPHEPIVGIPQIFEADEVGVVHFYCGDTSDLSYQFTEFFCACCSFLHETQFSFRQVLVEKVSPFPLTTSFYLSAHFLNFFVQFMQVHISKDWA